MLVVKLVAAASDLEYCCPVEVEVIAVPGHELVPLCSQVQVTLLDAVKLIERVLEEFKSDEQYKTWLGGGVVTGLVTLTVTLVEPTQEPVVPKTV